MLDAYPAIDPARVEVIYNGIDTAQYAPDPDTDVLERHGIDPGAPIVVFVGRITRQKGLVAPARAALRVRPRRAARALRRRARHAGDRRRGRVAWWKRCRPQRGNVIWIDKMLPKPEVIQILTHSTVFVCPSIYEPLGIVNLEAMACETAVVATATGGIVEVVDDGETGLLVPFEPGDGRRASRATRAAFAHAIAERVNALVADPDRARGDGPRGARARSIERFAWPAIAEQTAALYRRVAGSA